MRNATWPGGVVAEQETIVNQVNDTRPLPPSEPPQQPKRYRCPGCGRGFEHHAPVRNSPNWGLSGLIRRKCGRCGFAGATYLFALAGGAA